MPQFRTFNEMSEDPDPEPPNDDAPDYDEWLETREGVTLRQASRFAPRPFHEICALELYNHIASGQFARVCQNETCGRRFVSQYGRSQHGLSRRTGVLYCTPSCAQAQAQREYRRFDKKPNA